MGEAAEPADRVIAGIDAARRAALGAKVEIVVARSRPSLRQACLIGTNNVSVFVHSKK
jgi:hypothetical protein